jgi:hypothetical protein
MMLDLDFRRLVGASSCVAITATLVLGLTGLLPSGASAQTNAQAGRPPLPAKQQATRPTWKELTPEQQQALQPLAPHWGTLPDDRKRKWLALSKNYLAMPPAEQAKLHSRMREWVQLSNQQRTQARLNYAETKTLTAEQKSAQWQAYQQLSAEEKRRLAAKAPAKPAGAAVIRPLPPEKLPHVGTTRIPRQESPAASPTPSPIHRNTLLPRQPDSAARPERIERPERPEPPQHRN